MAGTTADPGAGITVAPRVDITAVIRTGIMVDIQTGIMVVIGTDITVDTTVGTGEGTTADTQETIGMDMVIRGHSRFLTCTHQPSIIIHRIIPGRPRTLRQAWFTARPP